MNIQSPASISQQGNQPPTPQAVKSAELNLSRLFIGQILNATVVEKKSADSFILIIGNYRIDAKINQSHPLNIGEQLKLIVEKQNNPATFRVIQPDSKILTQDVKQQLLRESFPKQAGMEKLIALLSQISKNINGVFKNLPLPIEQQFKKLINQLPVKSSLNNEAGIKTAIKNSGLFLEAKLLSDLSKKNNSELNVLLKEENQPQQKNLKQLSNYSLLKAQHLDIEKDLKTNLLQLSKIINHYKKELPALTPLNDTILMKHLKFASVQAVDKKIVNKNIQAKVVESALKVTTESLNKQIESSIARIEVNQSKAIVSNDNQSPLWSVEIPVKDKQDIDLLKLNIEADKDSENENDTNQAWATDLKITFENIGTISAKLSIIGKEVNASLWSENEILNVLIDENLSILNEKIAACGLASGNIVCLKEAPVEESISATNNNLINITI